MILILEDDILIAEHIKTILMHDGFDNLVIANSYQQARDAVKNHHVRLALLDINLNEEKCGFDFASYLNNCGTPYLFISAQSDPLNQKKIIEYNPLGYILKPFKPIQVSTTVRIIYNQVKEATIDIDDGRQKYRIHIDKICYIKSNRNYVEINCDENRFVLRKTLSEISELLPQKNFIQCHRSYIVNVDKIERISSKELFIKAVEIPISSKYKEFLFSF
jgi:two-component system, LytTR family, response regulator LytT